ncbi:polysaccharide deacetylase family protein [Actibacterium sp. MT2.3-13A]|uniref:polysaccharide deacetylase family protein n=1 Tax=Actibacterium sp. MT2.3-13A TaxID=2828332 RepID=UPI001BA8ED3D|nr:polysaccharide deacetylase family protein [Actibacterium sp. MT2.3-13A]
MADESIAPEIRRAPAGMKWPGGRNVAVILNVAYEMYTDDSASGVGPMGNPLPGGVRDPNAVSYGKYGANAGIQRLMRALDKAGTCANVFVSGMLAERDPAQVKAVADAGHEIVAHGWAQNLIPATLAPEEDEESIRRTTEMLEQVTGTRPRGWISPRATAGDETLRRLIPHGYEWQGDVLDADLPYLQTYPEGELVGVPLTIEINDLSHSMRFGRTPGQFIELFDQCLPPMLANEDDTTIIDVLVHTHCYGRPAGAWAYAEIARKCAERDDIWLTTRGAVADHFRAELQAATTKA